MDGHSQLEASDTLKIPCSNTAYLCQAGASLVCCVDSTICGMKMINPWNNNQGAKKAHGNSIMIKDSIKSFSILFPKCLMSLTAQQIQWVWVCVCACACVCVCVIVCNVCVCVCVCVLWSCELSEVKLWSGKCLLWSDDVWHVVHVHNVMAAQVVRS